MSYTPGATEATLFDFDTKFASGTLPADNVANTATTSIRARLTAFNSGSTWDVLRVGLTGSITSSIGILNVAPTAHYVVTRSILLDNQWSELQGNSRGDISFAEAFRPAYENNDDCVAMISARAIASSTGAPTNVGEGATGINVKGLVGKAAAGRLYELYGYCVLPYWIQIHNATSAPADTAVPTISIYVNANTYYSFDFGDMGRYFSTGIYVCASSTHATKTISTTSDTDMHMAVG